MIRLNRVALTLVLLLTAASGVLAQATRTWVSGVGDDVNPCSRTAPCKTFAGAISKTAAGGVISVLDPGGFGAVTITKSITIDGGGIEGSILASGVSGVIVNVGANDHVTLRNLSIYGTGTASGIRVLNASGHVTIENCEISGFATGIDYNASGQLYVYDTFSHKNTGFGSYFRQGRATFEGVRFENNGLDGLRVGLSGVVTVRRSSASGHSNIGFASVDSGTRLILEEVTANNNVYGVAAASDGALWVSNAALTNNTASALYRDLTGVIISFGNNRFANNTTNGTFSSTVLVQ